MSRDIEDGASSASIAAMNAKEISRIQNRGYAPVSAKSTSLDSAHVERGSLLSLSLSLGGLVRDDPRVVCALEEYLEALSAGRHYVAQ